MIPLPARADLYRRGTPPGTGQMALVQSDIACLIEPISNFDRVPDWARQSSHLILVPKRLTGLIRKQDQFRSGRRLNLQGQPVQFIYTVTGFRAFRFGLQHTECFCQEVE